MNPGVEFVADLAVVLLTAAGGAWLARSCGLTSVVGYLLAGLVVGAPEITMVRVADVGRVQVISQVGLIFLMFSIGARIRLREVRNLGLSPILATLFTALLVFVAGRLVGQSVGLDAVQSLFFAAMLMVSSSAIIVKVLTETGGLHGRPGQLALSQTLLEDFVAVVMLTVLGSVAAYGQAEAGGWTAVGRSLGQLLAFIILFVVTGLLLLPRILRRVAGRRGQEQAIILLTGIVFALALLTVKAGYSLALGAFLSGLLVAELPRSKTIERSFSGLRDVFTAVFFVAVGMTIDLGRIGQAWELILAGAAVALVGRFLFTTIAWLLMGEREPDALRAALCLTPVGEFSFIIAGLGVASGLLPPSFQAAAVGIALVTSFMAPLGMQHGEKIAGRLSPARFRAWRNGFGAYRALWAAVGRRGGSNLLWRMVRPRLWQIAREILWISALLLFARPLYTWAGDRLEAVDSRWTDLLPWTWWAVLLLALPSLVALWRNLDAMGLLLADYLGMQSARWRGRAQSIILLFRTAFGTALVVWLVTLLPWEFLPWPVLVTLLVLAAVALGLGWRRFVRWHARAEVELREIVAGTAFEAEQLQTEAWENARRGWGLELAQVELPDHFAFAGRSIAEVRLRERTGASLVGIERQGWRLSQPGPQTHLFPGDLVLLVGRPEELATARGLLGQEADRSETAEGLRQPVLEGVRLLPGCPLCGRRLAELNWPRLEGVQVVAARRGGIQYPSPGPDWCLAADDELLLVGAASALRRVFRQLEPPAPVEEPAAGERPAGE